MTSEAATPTPMARRSGWLAAGAGAIVLVAGAGFAYWRAASPAPPAGAAPHPMGGGSMQAVVQKLADRLQREPGDAAGWAMLARSYASLDRHADALAAYARAVELRSDDAAVLADYADELALRQGGRMAGEPMAWVQRALTLEPGQPKALLLAGTEAFERADYARATGYWNRVLQSAPPGSGVAKQAQAGLQDARGRSGARSPN